MPERAVHALWGSAAGVALLIITWLAAFHVGIVERADQSIYAGFGRLGDHPHLAGVAGFVAGLCNPQPYVYLCAVPVALALWRRRLWVAAAIGAILLGANGTTQLLKPLLAAHRASALLGHVAPPAPASWPSGHATAAMALALCIVLAAPARWRPLAAAAGASFAVAVSYSFLALEWHYATDVLGGFLVAGTWALLGVAAVFAAPARRAPRASSVRVPLREALTPPVMTLFAAALLALLVVFARPREVVAYARLHEAFLIGAAGIGALGLAVATAVMLTLRREAGS